jgi:hypothetical protein
MFASTKKKELNSEALSDKESSEYLQLKNFPNKVSLTKNPRVKIFQRRNRVKIVLREE